jgi:uncharacterized membrane protein YdjX (TVP38/TMEM64 family)
VAKLLYVCFLKLVCLAQVADILAIVVAFPGAFLAVAAGAIFGVVTGSLLVWIGTTIGQTVAFIVGR